MCLVFVFSRVGFQRWWVIFVLAATSVLQSLVWNCFSPISKTVKLAYGWTDSDFAWAANFANISFMLTLVPINKLLLGANTGSTLAFLQTFLPKHFEIHFDYV